MLALKALFWLALGALLWTHVLYPLGAAALRACARAPVRKAAIEPTVTVIVAAYNEEPVIERRLENLLALDYPADKLEIVVASDASTDRTNELVERSRRGPRCGCSSARAAARSPPRTVPCARPAATWSPSPTRTRPGPPTRCGGSSRFADPEVAYVCGQLRSRRRTARTGRALYWRYEMWLREEESRLGSITGGNGSIYAVRRADYVEVDPTLGPRPRVPVPDGAERPPRRLRARGARVREADPVERDRVPAQGAHVRALLGDHAARLDAAAAAARLPRRDRLPPPPPLRERRAARRAPRRASLALVGEGLSTSSCSPRSSHSRGRGRLGVGIARYYALVTWATVVALSNYLRRGVPATWEAAEGTR